MELDNCQRSMRDIVNVGAVLVAGNEIGSLAESLHTKVTDGEIPISIKAEFIDRLVEHGTCICGNHVPAGSPGEKALVAYRNQLPREESATLVEVWGRLGILCRERQTYIKDLRASFTTLNRLKEEKKAADATISGLSDEIKDLGGDTTRELGLARERLEGEEIELKAKALRTTEDLAAANARIVDLDSEIRREERLLTEGQHERNKRDLVDKAIGHLTNLQEQFTRRVREDLQDHATRIFKDLADEGTLTSLDHIAISNDYTLDVMGTYGKNILADISAGQRQIVSLAFITALIRVASGEGTFEVPLFMDTPFGRLSGEHRDALLRKIPLMASQWVLLSTDTEMSSDEVRVLQSTGRWGKLYLLQATEAGVTTIKEEQIGAFQPARGAGAASVR